MGNWLSFAFPPSLPFSFESVLEQIRASPKKNALVSFYTSTDISDHLKALDLYGNIVGAKEFEAEPDKSVWRFSLNLDISEVERMDRDPILFLLITDAFVEFGNELRASL